MKERTYYFIQPSRKIKRRNSNFRVTELDRGWQALAKVTRAAYTEIDSKHFVRRIYMEIWFVRLMKVSLENKIIFTRFFHELGLNEVILKVLNIHCQCPALEGISRKERELMTR